MPDQLTLRQRKEARWVISMPGYMADCLLGEPGEAGIRVGSRLLQSGQSGGCGRPDLTQSPSRTLANLGMRRSGNGSGQGGHGKGSFGLESSQQSRRPVADIGRPTLKERSQLPQIGRLGRSHSFQGRRSPLPHFLDLIATGQHQGDRSRLGTGAKLCELLCCPGSSVGIRSRKPRKQSGKVALHG